MKKHIVIILLLCSVIGRSQTVNDLFKSNDTKISWLGVDYTHVRLIGDFSQFSGIGEESSVEIRNKYFPAWNKLILSEPKKYDLKGMLRKGNIFYDIDLVMGNNYETAIEELESYNNPNYSLEQIKGFVKEISFTNKEGIGVIFIAESLNKNNEEAYFHFVAIKMATNEILIHERLRGEPRGFGIRNYWAGSIYDVMNQIRVIHYKRWKKKFK